MPGTPPDKTGPHQKRRKHGKRRENGQLGLTTGCNFCNSTFLSEASIHMTGIIVVGYKSRIYSFLFEYQYYIAYYNICIHTITIIKYKTTDPKVGGQFYLCIIFENKLFL